MHSILYWVDRNNILGPAPQGGGNNNSQFNHWEIPVQNWWAQNKTKYHITTSNEKPTALDNIHTDLSKPKISILAPNNINTYPPDQKINLKILSSGIFPLQKIDIFINGVYLETVKSPFNFSFTPKELENLQSDNELKIMSYDTVYNNSETTLMFKVSQ